MDLVIKDSMHMFTWANYFKRVHMSRSESHILKKDENY